MQIHNLIVEREVTAAYADCWMEGERGYKLRNLNYRAPFEVTQESAVAIMMKAVPGYNAFKPDLLKKFPKCATFQLAREGSVCVYVRANGGKLPSAKTVKADEKNFDGDFTRYWWDWKWERAFPKGSASLPASMKTSKPKIRVSKEGLMGLATRVHKPKTGKGSYKRVKSKENNQE